MGRIDDTTLSIVLKLAAKASLEADVEMYKNLDVRGCTVSERVKRKFRRSLAWELGRPTRRRIIAVTKHVAVACLAVCTLLFGAAMCIEPIRAAFVEAVITWYEDYIGFRFVQAEAMEYPTTIEHVYLPGNLSEEWVVTEVAYSPTGIIHRITGPNDENICLEQLVRANVFETTVDNVDAEIEETELNNGTKAYLTTYSMGENTLIWYGNYLFKIAGKNTSKEMIYHIANGLR
ncbi:MAG: hypothetical protein IJX53_04555 [Clostridia bacterium]|nr:hypothetical protein [Clostridia bacterium]